MANPIEERVLSIFLRHPEEILKHELKSGEFENKLFAQIFAAMIKLAAAGQTIDPFVIDEQIDSSFALTTIIEIQEKVPAAVGNIAHYIGQIKNAAKSKKLAAALKSAISSLTSGNNAEPDAVIGELITTLSSFSKADNTKVFGSMSMMQHTVDHLDRMFELKRAGKLAGVPSGIKKLDNVLGGFHHSDLIIVGARPAMGKTAWMLSCATNAARQGFRVGIISTEMSVTQLGMRVTSLISGIPSSKMRDSSFDNDDWPRLTAATAQISELPLFIYDQPSCTVSDIAIQARAWAMTSGLDIIFVDYLTRLKPESNKENRTLAVGDIATGLKTLARTLNIPVVVLAQLSRDCEKRTDRRPMMADLRDSGVIEQEADQILMLYRASVYDESAPENDAQIFIDKNRHGEVLTLNLEFHKEVMCWTDPYQNKY